MMSILVLLACQVSHAQTIADADFDGSGEVAFSDFLLFTQAFGSTKAQFDLDGSGEVGFFDFLVFAGFFGKAVSVELNITTLASGLDTLWDLAWGPDDFIWVTERKGTISRVNPTTGAVTQIGVIAVVEQSESFANIRIQSRQ